MKIESVGAFLEVYFYSSDVKRAKFFFFLGGGDYLWSHGSEIEVIVIMKPNILWKTVALWDKS